MYMIYCQVIDGTIVAGPRPLPTDISQESALVNNWYPTIFLNMPHHIESDCNPVTQHIQMKMNFVGDKVECYHVIEDRYEDDIESVRQLLLSLIREQRNQKLLNSDWTQLPNAPISTDMKIAWEQYRQALRDFPENVQIDNVVWPTVPMQVS
jgi:hypothetical protein